MPVKKQDFIHAALKKGYRQVSKKDHIFLRYVDENGKIIDAVHTKVSHGGGKNGVISDSLLAKMAHQMKFDAKKELTDYVACTYSLEKYRQMLVDKGFDK